MKRWEQYLCFAAAVLLIAPGLTPTLIGAALAIPMLLRHVKVWRLAAAHA
jgi:UPF0716 family protein affecting phage T7 exclusion